MAAGFSVRVGFFVAAFMAAAGCSSPSSGGPSMAHDASFCGDGVIDPGEVCDPGVADGTTCSSYCKSACGNGAVELNEVCDDGNLKDGDACSRDCSEACGNGKLEAAEVCDDGNRVAGDGCYLCRSAGTELWSNADSCIGPLMLTADNTVRVLCNSRFGGDRTHLSRTFSLDGAPFSADPPALTDPAELEVLARNMVQLAGGQSYVTASVRRNLLSGPSAQVRTRVYRLAEDGTPLWHTDLEDFPGGRWEEPIAAAAFGDQLVVAGSSNLGPSSPPDPQSFVALVAADGSVVWKLSLGPSTAVARVAVGGDGTIYVGGSASEVNLWALDEKGKELWQWHQEPGVVDDLQVSNDAARVLSRRVDTDDLVPNPPRITAIWTLSSVNAMTGAELESRTVRTEVSDGKEWESLDLPGARFSTFAGLDYYFMGPSGGQAYRADDSLAWSTQVPITASVVQGSLIQAHVLCVSAFSDLTPNLACYLTD